MMDLDLFKEKIKDKRNGLLSYDELAVVFNGYISGDIDDDDMTDVLKLICKYELEKEEIFHLVDIFIKSGEVLEYNSKLIDKHSTGGVGDKTTLIVLPILASLGVKISKMSGRALGYTGGTIDKLESIGVKTNLSRGEFYDFLNKTGMVISSQTDNLCPMDKKVYALRDVTGTTKSISLIASSIMSKKIASGAGMILIDVKVGKGALVENEEDARRLANLMIEIGNKYERKVICMLTRMDVPLGSNVGNKIEIMEVLDILANKKDNDLKTLAVEMASLMYTMIFGGEVDDARSKVNFVIENGDAYNKFLEFVNTQGGFLDLELSMPRSILSSREGYITNIDAMNIGFLSMSLGAGRSKKDDNIDYRAGVILNKEVGDYVNRGDVLMNIYGNLDVKIGDIDDYFKIDKEKVDKDNIIIEVIK